MFKNDLEMLATACLVGIILCFANLNSISKSFDSLSEDVEAIRQSEGYKSFLAFKDSETEFWTNLKGTKSSNGEIADILKDAPPETNTDQQTVVTKRVDAPKITTPIKVLLVGDSMMLVGFGPALENALLKYKDVSVVRAGEYSTGLNRIDYFDWFTKTEQLIADNKPDIVVVMFGGNDGQGIKDKNGKASEFGTENWKEIYRQRVNVYLTRIAPKVKKIYWVGQPITANEGFLAKFQTMNPIFQSETAKFPNAVYVDTWERFSVNGEYRRSIPDDNGLRQIAKQSDDVHVTDFGGGIMSGLVIKAISNDAELK